MKNAEISILLSCLLLGPPLPSLSAQSALPSVSKEYGNANLEGWETVVGDGLYTAAGEMPVTLSDITTANEEHLSRLRANVLRRRIMAHNITFKRIIDEDAFDYVHTYSAKFRLPNLPTLDTAQPNGETVEFGIFVWDGGKTRLDYGTAYQWKINPHDRDNYGVLQYWNGRQWVPTGRLAPDTGWHQIRLTVNYRTQTSEVAIDGAAYPSQLTATAKDPNWGRETAARIQAEIVSIFPGAGGTRVEHDLEVKDWNWKWDVQPRMLSAQLPWERQ